MQYRVDLFDKIINNGYDVNIICSENCSSMTDNIQLTQPVSLFGFNFYSWSFFRKKIVLFECDLRTINTYLFTLNGRNISWGMWKTNNVFANLIRILIANLTKSNIFYCEEHKRYFDRFTINKSKNFVAPNTIEVSSPENEPIIGSYYISIGSLNERKGIKELINCFECVLEKHPHVKLLLVGSGTYREEIELFLKSKKPQVKTSVLFLGSINNKGELSELYKNAICSVSYGQAGLSILQSLGNATPFITTKNAISGGEIHNIIEGITGFKNIDNQDLFIEKMLWIHENKIEQIRMKKKSLEHYKQNASIEAMCEAIIKAIEYAK